MLLTLLSLFLVMALFGALVVPDQGEQLMVDAAIGKTAATAWTLRLFANNHTPVAGDTEANYTEATGGGYSAIALTAENWVTTAGGSSPDTTSVYPQQTFTFTGPLTTNANVYGYYITNAGGKLIYAELLASQFTPTNNGDNMKITLQLTTASVSGN